MYDKTMTFSVSDEKEIEMKKTLMLVYDALTKKGYNPVNQIVGYIMSGASGKGLQPGQSDRRLYPLRGPHLHNHV